MTSPPLPRVAPDLPPRLRGVLELVPEAAVVADIGSGHGRLATGLAARGARVVAVERTAASFARLQVDLRRDALQAPALGPAQGLVEPRLGDGIAALEPGEVEVAVIAGLGGRGIMRILERAPWLPRWLVLQPMQDPGLLAAWLDARGWPRDEARMAQRGRWYVGWCVEVPAAERPAA